MALSTVAMLIVFVAFVASGSIATIGNKWADNLSAAGVDGKVKTFYHPFLQSLIMFLGEFSCLLMFRVSLWRAERRGHTITAGVHKAMPCSRFVFLLPAMCDVTGSTLMFAGLTMTQASVYQMLRGAVVVFTGIFSVLFLKRRLQLYQWFGIAITVAGLLVVGISASMQTTHSTTAAHPILGNTIIFLAQIVVAAQMCIEEKYVSKYRIPALQQVGWEGFWGTCVILTILGVMQLLPPDTPQRDSVIDAYYQVKNNKEIVIGNVLFGIAVPTLNYCGILITKEVSATTRMVLDTIRNIVVWVVTLALPFFGQKFFVAQLLGFLGIILGTAIYKNFVPIPIKCCRHEDGYEEIREEQAEEEDYVPEKAALLPAGSVTKPIPVNGSSGTLDVPKEKSPRALSPSRLSPLAFWTKKGSFLNK